MKTEAPLAIESAVWLPHNRVRPNPDQPRRLFDPDALAELSESIREHGIRQPIEVRYEPSRYDATPYIIVSGERRWRASEGVLEVVPCIISNIDANTAAELALVENIQRVDLTPIEEARAIAALMEARNLSQLATAKRLSKHPNWVRNRLGLLKTGPDVQEVAAAAPNKMLSLIEIDTVRDNEVRGELLEMARRDASHESIMGRIDAHREAKRRETAGNRAPDTETQSRLTEQGRSGSSPMSRGRLVTGTPKDEVRTAIEAALLELEGQAVTLKNWAQHADVQMRRDVIEPRLARLRRQLREIGAGE